MSTYRYRSISCSPLDDGGVASSDDWPWLINGLHADLLTVYQQLHLTALHAQRQLVPLSIKELFHAMEGPQHLAPMGASVEEVQRACVALETQANLVSPFGITNLPQVPGFLGCVLGHLKCGNDRVVGGKSIWIDIAVAEWWGTQSWLTSYRGFSLQKITIESFCGNIRLLFQKNVHKLKQRSQHP